MGRFAKSVIAGMTLAGLVGLSSGCKGAAVPMRETGIPQGAYHCMQGGKDYNFDSMKDDSRFYFDDMSFEFRDVWSGEEVELEKGAKCEYLRPGLENNSNWVALQVWDSFYPLNLDKTLPETLMSLEIIFQQHANYTLENMVSPTGYGNRSNVGHYMLWVHFSDDFVKRHPKLRRSLGDDVFMFDDRNTDVFVGWGGDANIRDFVLKGVSGLANPVRLDDGTYSGSLQGFDQALSQGTADFEGGWFMSDSQAERLIGAYKDYRGYDLGYTFVSRAEVKPNAPFESPRADGTNGFNCIDFAYHLLTQAGIVDRADAESFKSRLWYPQPFWNSVIPLEGAGKKIYDKYVNEPGESMLAGDLLRLGWYDLFFSGVEFFNEGQLIDYVWMNNPKYNSVRIWDQTKSIEWLKDHVDFRSKRVKEDLLPYTILSTRINSPFPIGPDRFRFRDSDEYKKWLAEGDKLLQRKRKKAGLVGSALNWFSRLEYKLKK